MPYLVCCRHFLLPPTLRCAVISSLLGGVGFANCASVEGMLSRGLRPDEKDYIIECKHTMQDPVAPRFCFSNYERRLHSTLQRIVRAVP